MNKFMILGTKGEPYDVESNLEDEAEVRSVIELCEQEGLLPTPPPTPEAVYFSLREYEYEGGRAIVAIDGCNRVTIYTGK